jgi:hypothetical protein
VRLINRSAPKLARTPTLIIIKKTHKIIHLFTTILYMIYAGWRRGYNVSNLIFMQTVLLDLFIVLRIHRQSILYNSGSLGSVFLRWSYDVNQTRIRIIVKIDAFFFFFFSWLHKQIGMGGTRIIYYGKILQPGGWKVMYYNTTRKGNSCKPF